MLKWLSALCFQAGDSFERPALSVSAIRLLFGPKSGSVWRKWRARQLLVVFGRDSAKIWQNFARKTPTRAACQVRAMSSIASIIKTPHTLCGAALNLAHLHQTRARAKRRRAGQMVGIIGLISWRRAGGARLVGTGASASVCGQLARVNWH